MINIPTKWKTATIKALQKNSTIETVKDLRPIGLVPILANILEEAAMLNVVDDLLAPSNENRASILVLLDYSRAFDCMNRNFLVDTLNFYVCDGVVCSWFSIYFNKRIPITACTDLDG